MKAIFITSLTSSSDAPQSLAAQVKPYGIPVMGHFWIDDLRGMAWMGAREKLAEPDTAVWVILGSKKDFEKKEIRYGLSLLALSVQSLRRSLLPVMILREGDEDISADDLPTPFKDARIFPFSGESLGVKLVAAANQPPTPVSREYYFDVLGNETIGQWFGIRPAEGAWTGAMLGVSGGNILFHAVGPAGRLPDKTVLNYPLRGMTLALGDAEYTAWAAQNPVNPETAYYVKVENHPSSILFGPYSDEDAADVYVVKLA